MDTTRPHGVGPIVARSATRRRSISAIVTRHATLGREISTVIARPRPVVARSHPYVPDPAPIVACCVLVVTQIFYNFRTCHREDCYFSTHSRALHTSRHALWTRRREVRDPSLRPFPCSPGTRSRQPYKYARVFSFLCTLLEHFGLYLPQQLLAGFSTGCFTFFIARHPPPLGFREHSAVNSALVILDYFEIKHYFFFNLGLVALGYKLWSHFWQRLKLRIQHHRSLSQ